jgi:hypothetical protein
VPKKEGIFVGNKFLNFQALILTFYKNQTTFKKILPYLAVFLLFQDLLATNMELLNGVIAKVINNMDELILLLGFPFIMIYYKKRKWKMDLLFWMVLSIFLLGLVSSILNEVPLLIMFQGAFLMLKGFIVLFTLRSLDFTEDDLRDYFIVFKRFTIIVLIFAVIDLLFAKQLRGVLNTDQKFDIRMGLLSVQSIFIHPGIYGWYLALVASYLIATYTVTKHKMTGIKSLVVLVASALSFRFKTIMAIIVNACFALVQNQLSLASIKKLRKSKIFIPVLVIGLIIGIVVLVAVFQLTILTIERYITTDYTQSARKALYMFGFIIAAKEFPFGVGFGRYGSWTAREHYSPVYYEFKLDKIYGLYSQDPKWATDTYWPSIMGEVGFIGMLILITIFAYLVINIYKGYKETKVISYKIFLLFTVMVFIQSFMESLGEQVYNSGPQYLFIFGTAGISLSILNKIMPHIELEVTNKLRNLRLIKKFIKHK